MHMVEYYSALKKEILIYAITWMSLKNIMLNETIQLQKRQILYDSTCMRYLKQSKTKRDKKTQWWLPGPWKRETELLFHGHRSSVLQDEEFWRGMLVAQQYIHT